MSSVGASPVEIAAIAHPDPEESIRRIHRFNLRFLLAEKNAGYVSEHHFILAYGQLNEDEKALDWLERGLEGRARWVLPLLSADPRLERVRRHPRYREILERAGPPHLRAD